MDKVKLLILEQNAVLGRFIKHALSSESANRLIRQTATISQALAVQSQWTPDVIVMDIRQPEMCGLDAIPLLLQQTPKAKVILLTDEDDTRYQRAAKGIGVRACLRKELIATKLGKLVDEVMNHTVPTLPITKRRQNELFLITERS